MLEYEKHIEAHRSSIGRGAKVTWIAGMCLGEIRTCSTTKCLVSDRWAKRLIQYNLNGLTTCNKYKAFSNSNQSACCLVTLRFLVVVPVPQDTLQRSQALQSPTVQSLEASRVSNKMWQSKHLAKLGLPSCFWAADIATISHIGLILGGFPASFSNQSCDMAGSKNVQVAPSHGFPPPLAGVMTALVRSSLVQVVPRGIKRIFRYSRPTGHCKMLKICNTFISRSSFWILSISTHDRTLKVGYRPSRHHRRFWSSHPNHANQRIRLGF